MFYTDKEKALLEKMKEDNYAMFDGNQAEALTFVEERLASLSNYVNVVTREQIMLPIWRDECDTADFQENAMKIDEQRRIVHNAAIDAVNVLNRMCAKYGLPPFADVDTTDRRAVAKMIGDYASEVYNDGIRNGGREGASQGKHANDNTKN